MHCAQEQEVTLLESRGLQRKRLLEALLTLRLPLVPGLLRLVAEYTA
jgi:hypothetical protein